MTHSLYIHDPNGYGVELLYELPREVWEGDIDAALNYSEGAADRGRRGVGGPGRRRAGVPAQATRTGLKEQHHGKAPKHQRSPGSATRTRSRTPAASATSSCRA